MRSRSVSLIWLAVLLGLAVFVKLAWPHVEYYQLTGRFLPISKIESLQSPVVVTNWCPSGLQLVDGTVVQLPGFRGLPTNSAALREVIKRGVEITQDGRVFGLVRVHHWCGNDPVREHIAKVDIANVLLFLKEGEPAVPPVNYEASDGEYSSEFSEWGWNVSHFHYFQTTQAINK